MNNKITIKCPDGYVLNQKDYKKGIISFIKKEKDLPISWEDFCERFPIMSSESFIDFDSQITKINPFNNRRTNKDKNVFINQKEAEKFLTLIQLRRMWWEYHKYEEDIPIDENKLCKYCNIEHSNNINIKELCINWSSNTSSLFWFKTHELAEMFFTCFKTELKQIEDLL